MVSVLARSTSQGLDSTRDFSLFVRPTTWAWTRIGLFRLLLVWWCAGALVGTLGVIGLTTSVAYAEELSDFAAEMRSANDPTVDESSGAAMMRIPIDVSPGPGGLQPELALTYSSDVGDSVYGVGWNLPIGEIRCSTRFGVPDYQSFASCPAYELNGQLLTGPVGHAAGGVAVFHTLIESFARIEYDVRADLWTVIRSDGRKSIFGATPDARVSVSGVTARWLLSEVRDPFFDPSLRNSIEFTYFSETGSGPNAMRYVDRIAYANDTRQIFFVYEDRPDPIQDFRGGLERSATMRLREVQVLSAGALFHRMVLHYDATGYATNRSRLTSVQRFGTDCPNRGADPVVACAGLGRPPVILHYGQSSAVEIDWPEAPGWDAPFDLVGNPWVFGNTTASNLFVDVNGDGLRDLIYDEGIFPATPSLPTTQPKIFLNDGVTGFETPVWSGGDESGTPLNDSAQWTDRLRELTFLTPQIRATQIKPVDGPTFPPSSDPYGAERIGVCSATSVEWVEDRVKTAASDFGQSPPGFDVTRNAHLTPDVPNQTRIRISGPFNAVDIDQDGHADLVLSMRLTGVHQTLDNCTDRRILPLGQEVWVEGATVRVVFRNTGDPATGWLSAPDLAASLPIMGVIAAESPEYVARKMDTVFPGAVVEYHPCEQWGLGGSRYTTVPPQPPYYWSVDRDFCINNRGFNPAFIDLNGDGYLDLFVEETDDQNALFFEPSTFIEGSSFAHEPLWRVGSTKTVAWIQDPRADASSPRWIRAPEFDPVVSQLTAIHSDGENQNAITGYAGDMTGIANNTLAARAVQYVDLNRDGLTDLIWNGDMIPFGSPSRPDVPTAGVLLNRGRGNAHRDRFSAWCSAAPLPEAPTVPVCPQAQAYLPPASDPFTLPHFGIFYWQSLPGVVDFVDVNGDGWVDLNSAWGRTYLQDPGANPRWRLDEDYNPPMSVGYLCRNSDGGPRPTGRIWLDLDGSGIPDILASGGCSPGFPSFSHSRIAQHEPVDMLTRFENGRGGTVHLAYQSPVVQQDRTPFGLEEQAQAHADATEPDATSHTGSVRWSTRPVLASLRVDGPNRPDSNGAAGRIETRFSFARPRYCRTHASGLGFRMSRVVRPDASQIDSFFYQRHALAGRLSERTIWDAAGSIMGFQEEIWDLVPAHTVRGAFGGGAAQASYVGRKQRETIRSEYGATPGVVGESIGAETTRVFGYDDRHGYNFVQSIDETRASGRTITLRMPTSDAEYGIHGLPYSVSVFDEHYQPLSRTIYFYDTDTGQSTRGRLGRQKVWVAHRDGGGPAERWLWTRFGYDAYGNRIQRVEEGGNESDPQRVTRFCYDGDADPECATGHGSHSLLVGIQNPLGQWKRFIPHAVLPRIGRSESDYLDEPTTEVEFDAFGRVARTFVFDRFDPSGARTQTERIVYDDFASPSPIETTYRYPDVSQSDAIVTRIVEDGFGAAWKRIEVNDGAATFRAIARYRDPRRNLSRDVGPISCGSDPLCANVSGLESLATEISRDALGRPLRRKTPDGASILAYRAATMAGATVDLVVRKNGKGDLSRALMDGARRLAVEQCANAPDPALQTLANATCQSPERTEYGYEPTGKLASIFDARTVAAGVYSDPSHRHIYRFDTLGRVVSIEDPDAGTMTTEYDNAGNVAVTTDARGLARVTSYDALDRPVRIQTPEGEEDVRFSYRPAFRQLWYVSTDRTHKIHQYDGLGRLAGVTRNIDGTVLRSGSAFDLLGRETLRAHPIEAGGNRSRVRFEYEGAYLKRVCDLGSGSDCAGAGQAIVLDASYSPLGQLVSIELPGGQRTFAYDPATLHEISDRFTSGASSNFFVDFDYSDPATGAAAYDGLGNLLHVTGTSSEAQPAFGAHYAYDAKNRLSAWQGGTGSTVTFAYDELGNLIDNAGATQTYQGGRPHAITSRYAAGALHFYGYDASGNVTSVVGAGAARYQEYDSANRLTCVGSVRGGCDILSMLYAGDGERLRETSDSRSYFASADFKYKPGDSNSANESWIEVHAFGERIATQRIQGGVLSTVASAFFGGGAVSGGSVEIRWVVSDASGSGLVEVDALGNRVRHTVYGPFGTTVADLGTDLSGRRIFAGHEVEAATGWVYMNARWYEPASGRFMSVDPLIRSLGKPQSINGYAYAENNPIAATDPTGMAAEDGLDEWGSSLTHTGLTAPGSGEKMLDAGGPWAALDTPDSGTVPAPEPAENPTSNLAGASPPRTEPRLRASGSIGSPAFIGFDAALTTDIVDFMDNLVIEFGIGIANRMEFETDGIDAVLSPPEFRTGPPAPSFEGSIRGGLVVGLEVTKTVTSEGRTMRGGVTCCLMGGEIGFKVRVPASALAPHSPPGFTLVPTPMGPLLFPIAGEGSP